MSQLRATPFGDALGPRGRRRVLVATLMAAAVVVALLAVAVSRFADSGQLEWERWQPLTEPAVLRFLLGGLVNTLKVASIALVGALAIGAVMALGRLSRFRPVRWLAFTYVEFFRSLPLLLLILFSVFGLQAQGIDISVFWALVMALAVYNGAVLAEILRAGILSVDRGQTDAALALGLRTGQAMRLVILPQAVRRMLPALVSQAVTLLKDTSLGFFIQYEELLRRGQLSGSFDRNLLQALIVVAAIYIAVNLTLSQVARALEAHQRRSGAPTMALGMAEELVVLGNEGDGGLALSELVVSRPPARRGGRSGPRTGA